VSFQIRSTERVTDAVRRVVGEQLAKALKVARDAGRPAAQRIHEVRLHLKRARALVRLVEGEVGRSARHDRRRLGEVGRIVARQRDRAAEEQALSRLSRPSGRAGTVAAPGDLARSSSLEDDELALRRIALGLARVRRGVCRWKVRRGRCAVRDGVRRSYARARRAQLRAREDDRDATLHGWRKRVKELNYQLEWLGRAAPAVHRALGPRLRRLGRLLGELHDLAGLRARIEGLRPGSGRAYHRVPLLATRGPLLAMIDARAKILRTEARALGAQTFEPRPADVGARVELSWRAWRRR
jgi:CHAD domain-containing protein